MFQMAKTINISLSNPNSVAKAISELQAIRNSLDTKAKQLSEELAKLGADVASRYYGASSGITVTVIPTEKGFTINANGSDVVFLEFGAGVTVDSSNPFAQEMPFDVSSGSWSVQDKQQFVTWGYWYVYGDKKMDRVVPTNAMYNASKEIKERTVEIAKKVFGND